MQKISQRKQTFFSEHKKYYRIDLNDIIMFPGQKDCPGIRRPILLKYNQYEVQIKREVF